MTFVRTPLLAPALLCAAWLPTAARADAVADWNEKAVAAVYAARLSPDVQSRDLAMVHIAVFEALNSMTPRYAPYRGGCRSNPARRRMPPRRPPRTPSSRGSCPSSRRTSMPPCRCPGEAARGSGQGQRRAPG
jgi:hypothetical protein